MTHNESFIHHLCKKLSSIRDKVKTKVNQLKGNLKKVVAGLALLLLAIALIYQQTADKKDILGLLQGGEPVVARFEALEGVYPSYKLWDASDNSLGYGVMADASGYGGKLRILTIVQDSGQIKNISLVEDHETPLYLKKVVDSGLLDAFHNHPVQDGVIGIDTVSGATVTRDRKSVV